MHPLNSLALLATIPNDVFILGVGGAFLKLHCLFAYDAVQETFERAFIVVRMISQRHSFPLRFQRGDPRAEFPDLLKNVAGPAGSLRAVSSSFAAIASSCRTSVSVRSADTLTTPTWSPVLLIVFILTSYGEALQRRLRLLVGDSETNRALGLFRLDL